MSLTNLLLQQPDYSKYKKLNKYANYIKDNSVINEVSLLGNDTNLFKCDFYGLLEKLLIPKELWYITMILNGYRSPQEYNGEKNKLLIIEDSPVVTILSQELSEFRRI